MKKNVISQLKEKIREEYGLTPTKGQLRKVKKWWLKEGRFAKSIKWVA
jgi:hypothetical protein